MNTFVTIRKEITFEKITYYSVVMEDEEHSLFLQFLKTHDLPQFEEALSVIRVWLQKLGAEIGADDRYFRHEKSFHALPPPIRYLDFSVDLRLYCMLIPPRNVILFGGGQKTAIQAQNCSNVGPKFKRAEKIVQSIDEALRRKDIETDLQSGELILIHPEIPCRL